ncbi:phospholipase D-like domain-containing protein [Mucilaginibacter sp.]|uniref:phospholipase D-like domain-containing protein n=1 Tax=Mucilaginibacter sp. TaxID=1882438 RepID=UPI0025DD16CA|nr:phospholipase D-like domain-containing protein [Mucilaginibacter sp.]
MNKNAFAFSNNDVITIAWSFGEKPVGCVGFAIYRIDNKDKEEALPNKAVFRNTIDPGDKSSEKFPIQKFYWKDVYARLEAERTGNRTFTYKIVPMEGVPGNFKPMTTFDALLTAPVTISPDVGNKMKAYFNRGIISTQRVANYLKKTHDSRKLGDIVAEYPGANELRDSLSGDMIEALTEFLGRAKVSGKIYAGLYELHDKQLVEGLCGLGSRLSVVLSNSVAKEPDPAGGTHVNRKGKTVDNTLTVDANDAARQSLIASHADHYARVMPNGHIGHNKFLVYEDDHGVARAVLFGSTNWTPTGLCTQTNNTMVIDDQGLAERYRAYWNQLKDDTIAAGHKKTDLQGSVFRDWNSRGETLTIDGLKAQSWFSPNTPKARSSQHTNEARPVDMASVIEAIKSAEQAILFLAFYPGSPSIANWVADAVKVKKDLFVRGMVTNDSASESFYYELVDEVPPKRVKGQSAKEDSRVEAAEAFDGTVMPEGWIKEILSAGFAIIHDKVMVIDPFSKNCKVITGSHNLGHKASYDNDENLVIIEGNRKLALAYTTHVLDIYDHFNYRIYYKKHGNGSNAFLEPDSEKFLQRYFKGTAEPLSAELRFWMNGALQMAK